MKTWIASGSVVAAICAFLCLDQPAPAFAGSVVRVSSNSGGRIGEFMSRKHEYQRQGSIVMFSGRCDSSCTLLMALPRKKTCIFPGTVFRFHAPKAASARTRLAAKRYMMAQYPGWVRSWIVQNRGLTARLITMDYRYASKFMRQCTAIASR